MGLSDLQARLAEQWRLVRAAPFPYLTGLILAALLIFGAFQWAYSRILENKDTEIEAWKGRVLAAEAERDNLRGKSVDRTRSTAGDVDTIYQLGKPVGHVEASQIRLQDSAVHFGKLRETQDLDMSKPFDYRQYTITGCRFLAIALGGEAGVTGYSDVMCQISGLHS